MRKNTLLGAMLGSTLIAFGISGNAQAATLTYNFTFNVYRGSNNANIGQFNGSFSLDNSGLTGVGVENVPVAQGTFDWLRAAVWYDPDKINNNYVVGLFPNLGPWDLAGSVAKILDGRFQGIMANGYDSASKDISSNYWYSNNTWKLEDKSFNATWDYGWSWLGSGSEDLYGQFKIEGPEEVVEMTETEAVPEPLTMLGSILGFGAIALRRAKRKST